MTATKIAALVLIAAGVLGLAYGGFTYTKDTSTAQLGPIELSVKEQQTVNIPVWLGAGAIIAGVLLLVVRRKV
jgi:LPXTG-motif cell wall-anchored protein